MVLIAAVFATESPAATIISLTDSSSGRLVCPNLTTSSITPDRVPAPGPGVSSENPSITCGERSDVVVFSEEGGYGMFPTIQLGNFVWDALQVSFRDAVESKSVATTENDFFLESPVGVASVPESWSLLIGGVALLLLLQRRRS